MCADSKYTGFWHAHIHFHWHTFIDALWTQSLKSVWSHSLHFKLIHYLLDELMVTALILLKHQHINRLLDRDIHLPNGRWVSLCPRQERKPQHISSWRVTSAEYKERKRTDVQLSVSDSCLCARLNRSLVLKKKPLLRETSWPNQVLGLHRRVFFYVLTYLLVSLFLSHLSYVPGLFVKDMTIVIINVFFVKKFFQGSLKNVNANAPTRKHNPLKRCGLSDWMAHRANDCGHFALGDHSK